MSRRSQKHKAASSHKKESVAPEHGASRPIWPFIAGVALFFLMLAAMAAGAYYTTGGHITYALDDSYIHMALAKNLATHGVLGATPFEFTSASSSPLWTLTLGVLFAVFGVHDALPLLLCVLFALSVLYLTDEVLCHFGLGDWWRVAAQVWVVFVTPMAPIVFGGMEHPLQILIDLALVWVTTRLLVRDGSGWDRLAWTAIGLSVLAAGVRYEGAVLVAVVAAAFAVRRRWAMAGALSVAAALPIVGYGFYSLANGGFFFPNPVLIKGSATAGIGLLVSGQDLDFARLATEVKTALPLYPLLAASIALLVLDRRRGDTFWRPTVVLPLISVTVTTIHLVFGDVGWFFRYEDYMIVLLGLAVLLQLHAHAASLRHSPRAALLYLGVAFSVLALLAGGTRAVTAWTSTPWACRNVYEQQYQMAHFLKANPQYDSVAIGDLGAISYFNDNLRILDLEGLAESRLPLESLGRQNLDAEKISGLATRNQAQIAIVFPDYFDLPSDWIEVARWTIPANLVAAKDTVVFMAIPPTDPVALQDAVREYSDASLPKAVKTTYVTLPSR